ncbi:SCO family protein [Thiomicrorhabdus sp. ZW0627]|uniref:SCO family protein n=1 Tax=Thiomicrorhabdus sp. ZW0627 TaxID=3039774 RepID=UPI002436DAE4|nr:SCO family protein [Thiomicrorhabdus sp. ZW0627]MDG6773288.1 SCO family protein [Thiomicrorhabdus sp. ZW0627]
MKTKYLISVIVLGILLGIGSFFIPSHSNSSTPVKLISSDAPHGGDFTLNAADGKHSLSDFKNKLVLIYFGYTYCPDICPTNLGNLSVAYRRLTAEEKAKTQILFISVDPERDTPKRLKQYSDYFEAGIIGLTSDPDTIAEVSRRYGVVYAKVDDPNNGTNYSVDHSAFTYVVDQQGQLREQLPHATNPDNFVKTIRKYLEK